MKIRILGSGTSSGVPVPGCTCAVCKSANSKNNRLRTSIYIELEARDRPEADSSSLAPQSTLGHILVDTSPDLRQQVLRENISQIEAVLYTHTHADHVFGIDDLRSFNFINDCVIDCYASVESAKELELRFPYAFFPDPKYQGGAPPRLTLNRLTSYEPLQLFGVNVLPLPLMHGAMEVLGFRVGAFAYLTDCSQIPDRSRELLRNLDVLIIDGLRIRPHKTHFTHEQAVKEIEDLKPKRAFLTHLSHEDEHEWANAELKKMPKFDVALAYDGLVIDV